MKRPVIWLLLATLLGLGSGARAEDLLPIDALEKLGESAAATCPTCVRQLQKEAFEILSRSVHPGRVIRTSARCRLTRSDSCEANELMLTCFQEEVLSAADESRWLPQVVFRFHTDADHLVGIAPQSYTPAPIKVVYEKAPIGTEFTGSVEIISFRYGDGPAFLYTAATFRLQIHCRILTLEPVYEIRDTSDASP